MRLDLLKDYKHKELTYQILNAAFKVHNTLGCGFLEKVYENALVYELKLREFKIEVGYKGEIVGNYISDLIIEEKVVVELKAVEEITGIHKAQMLNYLKAIGCEVGLILNFAKPKLEYKRLVLTKDGVYTDKI